MFAACAALWPWVLTNTMVARSVGAGWPVRAFHSVFFARSTCPSSSTGMRKRSRRLEISSSSDSSSSFAARTSTKIGRMDLASTRSQKAVGLSRAYALREVRMEGRVPSLNGARLAPPFCDFCSASFCARSTRMDHAMSDRHTAVVSDPPIFVMCMAMAPCARGRRAQTSRDRAATPRPGGVPECSVGSTRRLRRGGWENIFRRRPLGSVPKICGVGSRVARPTSMRRFFLVHRRSFGRLPSCHSLILFCGAGRAKGRGKTSLLGDDARGSLHRAKASSFEP